ELSLVCETKDVPEQTLAREDGWKAFRIQGVLDFSLTGILSKISGLLAGQKIGIFAISTYNTDYVLTKAENFEAALHVLEAEGYSVI
ncbi:MAG TPA: ACT domain-containing protein, partial [Lachnospiraceae bacterium]|nr:ACT domain-containing protein [Lachnospiraceae bacterium]